MRKANLIIFFTIFFALNVYAQDKLPRTILADYGEIFTANQIIELGKYFKGAPKLRQIVDENNSDKITHMGIDAAFDFTMQVSSMESLSIKTSRSKVFEINLYHVDKNNPSLMEKTVKDLIDKYKKFKTTFKDEDGLKRYYFEDDQTKMELRLIASKNGFMYIISDKNFKIQAKASSQKLTTKKVAKAGKPEKQNPKNDLKAENEKLILIKDGKKIVPVEYNMYDFSGLKETKNYLINGSRFLAVKVSDTEPEPEGIDYHKSYHIFVPYDLISKIETVVPNKIGTHFRVFLRNGMKPIFCDLSLQISYKVDMGDFGIAKASGYLKEFSEVQFPNKKSLLRGDGIETGVTATITTISNKIHKLKNFYPTEFTLIADKNWIKLDANKVAVIDGVKAGVVKADVVNVQLKTGVVKEFKIQSPSFGICGKGENWIEYIRWKNIKSIEFN